MEIRQLPATDVGGIAAIDRSEHVDTEYAVVWRHAPPTGGDDGEIPPWDPDGTGPHTVAATLEFFTACLAGGWVPTGVGTPEPEARLPEQQLW